MIVCYCGTICLNLILIDLFLVWTFTRCHPLSPWEEYLLDIFKQLWLSLVCLRIFAYTYEPANIWNKGLWKMNAKRYNIIMFYFIINIFTLFWCLREPDPMWASSHNVLIASQWSRGTHSPHNTCHTYQHTCSLCAIVYLKVE